MTGVARQQVAGAARLVVKVGSSSLTGPEGGLEPARVDALCGALAACRLAGREVVLVSSGAIAAGLPSLGLRARPADLTSQQAAASVGQGLLMAHYARCFAAHGLTVGQVLLTSEDVARRAHYRNAQGTLFRLLELGVVPVVNENDTVATDEIRFGDNDRLAALVSHVVQADALILLSDVDGLYDGPPERAGTQRVPEVRDAADLARVQVGGVGSAVGLGGMATKVEAARIATSDGIPVVLCRADQLADAVGGSDAGTFFHPAGRRRSARQLWLAHATTPRGAVVVDAGAVQALTTRGTSLLPAGINAVRGDFRAGDVIDVLGPDGSAVARGITDFDAAELPALLGRSTRDIAAELGSDYEREVIHRDDLVLLDSAPDSLGE